MDWTKAKTILILALLVTNLFLLGTYAFIQVKDATQEENIQIETLALLEAKNISVKIQLPLKHSKMPVLNVKYDRLDPALLKQQLWDQVPLDENHRSRESILQMTEDFINSCRIGGSNVVLDRLEQQGQTTIITYKNVYEGMLIEDSYIICTVEDGQIIELERYWLKPLEFGRTKKETISASAALINFMSEKKQTDSIMVEDMKMVYWLDSSDYGAETTISDTAFPAWKITYNDGQIKYVPAYAE